MVIPLETCPACRGRALVRGVFFDLDCEGCNGSGWVRAGDGKALELRELVKQLGFRLRLMKRELEQERGRQHQVVCNNRRGAGASHFTGD